MAMPARQAGGNSAVGADLARDDGRTRRRRPADTGRRPVPRLARGQDIVAGAAMLARHAGHPPGLVL
jgi:hypothetical protein